MVLGHGFTDTIVSALSCPICRGGFRTNALAPLVCRNGHSFDPAKTGDVSLLRRSVRTKYDAALFASRRALCRAGMWNGLLDVLAARIREGLDPDRRPSPLLDAGCGEGSPLAELLLRLRRTGPVPDSVGIDTAASGIRMAAGAYRETAWITADLARMPLADRSFSCVVNMLSPANYGEFGRILAEDGLVLKVVPNAGYLQELREMLYGRRSEPKLPAADGRAAQLFRSCMTGVSAEKVRYAFPVSESLLPCLMRMTPLAWRAGEDSLRRLNDAAVRSVTVDVTVLCGRPRRD